MGNIYTLVPRAIPLLLAAAAGQTGSHVWAQPGLGIEVNALAGKVIKHEAKFTLPIPSLTTGADVNMVWHTYGRQPWQQRRHYPRLGLAVAMVDYGIPSVYGTVYGIYPNITLPLANGNPEWTVRIGNGIGYVTNKYSRTGTVNTVNVAIGASLNDFIMLRTDARYRINTHWSVNGGLFVSHISNGSVRKPNLGINVVGAGIGVSYYPATSVPARIATSLPTLSNRWLVQARYSMSLVSAFVPGGPLHPVYIGTLAMSRRWRSHNKLFAGADYSWHQSTYAYLHNNGLAQGQEVAQSGKAAIIAGNEFLLGRVGIITQLGVYVWHSYLRREDVYQKVCLSYYMVQRERGPFKELSVLVGVKSHLNVAEMGELGVGIGL